MHLIRAGVNLIYIRDLLGHADVSTTVRAAATSPNTTAGRITPLSA